MGLYEFNSELESHRKWENWKNENLGTHISSLELYRRICKRASGMLERILNCEPITGK